ncbi:haloacid dehalogenase superfamily, subfamily IA, variant 3 with third motif having DD or ED [Streptoalloteichus hindustanus]|uniref:Haloacid dehalogenase superfamily, subfamily IA, variant 3 with third motif having DD or ED n=1 Tax=Streptoalloteichus hindustanus TaxID=2017 RepID=A0A1M5I560_STRHI|nr:haloacid dehalogenase superfamily, subfamily IA, variant 3 with third motif having DD or ED [Streptoalloteichus hindustanus]
MNTTKPLAVRAVLFDMDGVVVDSRLVIESAWREVVRRHSGRDLTTEEVEEHVHGRQGSHTVAALFPRHTPEVRRKIWAEVDRIEETASYQAIPHVQSFLRDLHTHGVTVGLVTSSWTTKIEHVLKSLDVQDVFTVVVSRDDVQQGKPHPAPYLAGCRLLDVDPANTLVFEDSVSGVQSAVAAGTTCVGIGAPDLTEEGAADAVADFAPLRLVPHDARTLRLEGTTRQILIIPRTGS